MYIDFKYRFGFLLNGRKRKGIALTSVLPLIENQKVKLKLFRKSLYIFVFHGNPYFFTIRRQSGEKSGAGVSYNIL